MGPGVLLAEHKLEISGLSCGSCERIIERLAEKSGMKVKEIDGNTGRVVVDVPDASGGRQGGDINGFKAELAERGFFEKGQGAGQRGDFSRFAKFISSVVGGGENVAAESRLLNSALASFAGLLFASTGFYTLFLRGQANNLEYAPILFLTAVACALTVFSYFHASCYRKLLNCQNGMMVGMTMGMVPGFMVGAILGATNGMFIGSVAGMLFGMGLGYKLGKCCGIMGAMEGIMAGMMAGTMGAMLSVMMLRDNLVLFLGILFLSCSAVMAGLSYMLYREQGSAPEGGLAVGGKEFFFYALLMFILVLAVIFAGPKAALVYP